MAMDKSAADAYVYAKASGILARSFVGKRARELFNVHSLQELWSLVFKGDVPVIPEALLARELEKSAERRFVSEYRKLIENYEKPDDVLISLLHFYDYDNMKEIGAALCFNEKEMPEIADTGPYALVDYSKWPDIREMTSGGPLSWYNSVPAIEEQQSNDYRMDCQYVNELLTSAGKIGGAPGKAVLELFTEKFQMENVLWALRLKIFYRMDNDEVMEHLAYGSGAKEKDLLSSEARKILAWDPEDWEKWRTWKYSDLLNPHDEGAIWSLDTRWLSNSYNARYVQKAYRLFHQHPFTVCPIICWYIIKRHELDNIRTASECLRLSASVEDAMVVAGVPEVKNG